MAKKNVIAWTPGDTIKIDRAISKAVDAVILNGDNFMVIDLAKVTSSRDFVIRYIINVHHLNVIKEGNTLLVLDVNDDIKKAQVILKHLYDQALDKITIAIKEGKKEISAKLDNNDYIYRLCTLFLKKGFRVSLRAENTIDISWE